MKHDNKNKLTVAPSQLVLEKAEKLIESYGIDNHPSDNYLSRSYGFTLPNQPLTSLPESHAVYDEFAKRLPYWMSMGTNREEISTLPYLDASSEHLPDKYVSRASTILTILAHGYYIGDFMAGEKIDLNLPPALKEAYQTVARRLGRKHIGYTVYEGILYNWKFVNNAPNTKRIVENTELLVPLIGNKAECVSHMILAETENQAIPLISAIVNAQNAAIHADMTLLEDSILTAIDTVMNMLRTFMKINLVPYGNTYFNPIIWAKTAPVISAQYTKYELGMSGASLPSISLLDEFLGRTQYDSEMGQQELTRRKLLPNIHQEFIKAVSKISVANFIEQSKNQNLKDLWLELNEKYSGKSGFFGVHRRKIFNYILLGMKTGRATTNAGYQVSDDPNYKDAWDIINKELEISRLQRYELNQNEIITATITHTSYMNEQIIKVNFELASNQAFYIGDRCLVYVENSPELIKKTLKALKASATSKIELSAQWIKYLSLRLQKNVDKIISLSEFLKYAKIRPLTRDVVYIFFRLTGNKKIKSILDQHLEDQFELWDFLQLLQKEHYDVTLLWKISPWQRENISKILPPESPRPYSIATAHQSHAESNRFSIFCRVFTYKTVLEQNVIERMGTGSAFFTSGIHENHQIKIEIQTPMFFPLKEAEYHTNFFFAGGVGLSTFVGALQRFMLNKKHQQMTYLFLSFRYLKFFPYRQGLEEFVYSGKLTLYLNITQTDVTDQKLMEKLPTHPNFHLFYPEKIDQVIQHPAISELLYSHMLSNVNQETQDLAANFFICGSTEYCSAIEKSLRNLLSEKMQDPAKAQQLMLKNISNKYLSYDVFSGYYSAFKSASGSLPEITISEIARHNNPIDGYWMIINDIVYDIGEYALKHPGGDEVLFSCSGLDATQNYEKVEHHLAPEIESLLSFFKIGRVKKLPMDESRRYLTVGLDKKLITITLKDLYHNWIQFLYDLVEIENRLSTAFTTYTSTDITPLQAKIILDGHAAVAIDAVSNLYQNILPIMWVRTIAVYGEAEPIFAMQHLFDHYEPEDPHAKIVKKINLNGSNKPYLEQVMKQIMAYDKNFIKRIKEEVIKVHQLFETNPYHPKFGELLINALKQSPELISAYYAGFAQLAEKM